jgi:membrane protease YdiL (CAAX protease family)
MNELLTMLILFTPLILVIVLANLAEAQRQREEAYQGWAVTSYLFVGAFYGLLMLGGLLINGFALLVQQQPQLLEELTASTGGPNPLLQADSLPLLGVGLWAPALVGILVLLPPVRRLLARLLPMDAGSPVHAVALSLSALIVIQLLFTLGIGLNNLAESLAAQEAAGSASATLSGLWAQQVLTAVFAFFGVGFLIRRDWSATLQRLGLVVPSLGNIAVGIVVGLGMVPLVMLIEQVSSQFNIGIDPSVQKLTEQLLGPLFNSPLGIITLGVAAALGEETIFRGAVQPRFGIVLTALLFALVHSNYGISLSTLIVFLFGLLLGIVRKRTNTSTTMISHALYNMSLGILASLGF